MLKYSSAVYPFIFAGQIVLAYVKKCGKSFKCDILSKMLVYVIVYRKQLLFKSRIELLFCFIDGKSDSKQINDKL